MTLKEDLTLGIALLGAALGVINTWMAVRQRRVKLRVVPQIGFTIGYAPGWPSNNLGSIEVTNLSSFPVPIAEIGFLLGRSYRHGKRMMIAQPLTRDNLPFERILQPQQSITGFFDAKTVSPEITMAYARAESGKVFHGSGKALASIRKVASSR